jgi:hypothetical protein
MGSESEETKGSTASGSSGVKISASKNVVDILVLVSGTVDPLNTDEKKRSDSYRKNEIKDEDHYWEEHNKFKSVFDEFKSKRYNLHFFQYLGWSGDNSIEARKKAGEYLADRLCGANNEQSYYPKFLKKEVAFHLIGHSHGGNVINEMTRRIVDSSAWPKCWKIKSVTYLSTPFFHKLHHPKTDRFHKSCRIFNVFNRFDLTQRFMADFSLRKLSGVVAEISEGKISDDFSKIAAFKGDTLKALHVKPHLHVQGLKVKVDWDMQVSEGKDLYEECINVFNAVDHMLSVLSLIIQRLSIEKNADGKYILSSSLAQRFISSFREIKEGLVPTISAFNSRLVQSRFPVLGFVHDMNIDAFLRPLIDLLEIDQATLNGKLSGLLRDTILEQLEAFDDTTNSPTHQYADTPFTDAIANVDVTNSDPYSGVHDNEFARFITHIESLERDFEQTQSGSCLLDILFTVAAQIEVVHESIGKLAEIISFLEVFLITWDFVDRVTLTEHSRFEDHMQDLLRIFRSYHKILTQRDVGGLVATGDKKETSKPKRGDIQYLLMVSHGISVDAWPQFGASLMNAQLSSPLRKDVH